MLCRVYIAGDGLTNLVMFTYSCNLGCAYCFQRPTYDHPGGGDLRFDMEAIKASTLEMVRKTGNNEIVLHGGEPLLTPIEVLEEFIAWAVNNGLRVAVQSNGSLITERHIELFKRYGVQVGISCDGFPGENMLRGFYWEGRDINPKASQMYRERLINTIETLAREKILAGVIVILHKYNAGDEERLKNLVEFIKWVDSLGYSGRLNHMYANLPWAKQYELSNEELFNAYRYIYEAIPSIASRWSPYIDIARALVGDRNTICWFGGCNYLESFVFTVSPKGLISSCDRTMDRGEFFIRDQSLDGSLRRNMIRLRALLQTDLRDAKYPHIHKGLCPAEGEPAIPGRPSEWRRASKFVPAYEMLIEYMAGKIKEVMPFAILTSDVPRDRILEYLDLEMRGCRWDIVSGWFVCPQ